MEITQSPQTYQDILEILRSKINAAQMRALSSLNRELIEVYREIGKTIYQQQENGNWGDSVVDSLATYLQKFFPGIKGFSSRNLWRMKDFYVSYLNDEKLTTLSSEISWSHNWMIRFDLKEKILLSALFFAKVKSEPLLNMP